MRDVKLEETGRGEEKVVENSRHKIQAKAKLKIKNKMRNDVKNYEDSKVYVSICYEVNQKLKKKLWFYIII